MNDIRKLRITFEPTSANVDMVCAAVSEACSDFFRLTESAASIMDFCLIVTELMNNSVEHADSKVLDAELMLSGHEAVFRLSSDGQGFDPTQPVNMPDVEQDELPEGGYGLPLIQALADSMEYEFRGNRNTVTLRKTFPAKKGAMREKKSS